MERYDKPFCIIGSKGKFHHSYGAYLPALEMPEEPVLEEVKIIHKHIHIDRKALEHQERIAALETKSHTHTDKKTKKDTKYIYSTIKMEDDSGEKPLTN